MSNADYQIFEDIIQEMMMVYRHDNRPWLIGYSGGKDSTLLVSLVFRAVSRIPENERNKKVYVITSDTMVENPIVKKYMHESSENISSASKAQKLNIQAEIIYPDIHQTFWARVIGLGYPTPEPPGFRWCTERLKINPMNKFVEIIPPALFNFHFFDGEKVSNFVFDRANGQAFRKAFLQICGLDTFDLIEEQLQYNTRTQKGDSQNLIHELLLHLDTVRQQSFAEKDALSQAEIALQTAEKAYQKAYEKYRAMLKEKSVSDMAARALLAFSELKQNLYAKYISQYFLVNY